MPVVVGGPDFRSFAQVAAQLAEEQMGRQRLALAQEQMQFEQGVAQMRMEQASREAEVNAYLQERGLVLKERQLGEDEAERASREFGELVKAADAQLNREQRAEQFEQEHGLAQAKEAITLGVVYDPSRRRYTSMTKEDPRYPAHQAYLEMKDKSKEPDEDTIASRWTGRLMQVDMAISAKQAEIDRARKGFMDINGWTESSLRDNPEERKALDKLLFPHIQQLQVLYGTRQQVFERYAQSMGLPGAAPAGAPGPVAGPEAPVEKPGKKGESQAGVLGAMIGPGGPDVMGAGANLSDPKIQAVLGKAQALKLGLAKGEIDPFELLPGMDALVQAEVKSRARVEQEAAEGSPFGAHPFPATPEQVKAGVAVNLRRFLLRFADYAMENPGVLAGNMDLRGQTEEQLYIMAKSMGRREVRGALALFGLDADAVLKAVAAERRRRKQGTK